MGTQTLDLIGAIAELVREGRTLKEAAAEVGVKPLKAGWERIKARLAVDYEDARLPIRF